LGACAVALLLGLVPAALARADAVAPTNIPTIVTVASPDTTIGAGPLMDTVSVIGRVDPQPGATIDFALYGPDDATCAGPPLFQSVGVPYPVEGGPVSSASLWPPIVGTYRWRATYSGDANNLPVTAPCNDANENVVVGPAQAEPPAEPTPEPAAPRSALPLLSPFPIVRVVGRTTARGVKITLMTVRAGVGTSIVTRCAASAKGCPYRERRRRIAGPLGRVRTVRVPGLERAFRGGTVLRVFVVVAGRTGKFTSFGIRRGRAPIRIDHCLRGLVLSPVPCSTTSAAID